MRFGGFEFTNDHIRCGSVPLSDIADATGTPVFVYNANEIRRAFRELTDAFAPLHPLVCYAAKSLSNIHICRLIGSLAGGIDVVSGGELERAWAAGIPMDRVVFAGVGKTEPEIAAALDGRHSPLAGCWQRMGLDHSPADRGGIALFNIESPQEADRIARIAADLNVRTEGCVHVNPDIDARTHRHTTTGKNENKFGMEPAEAFGLFDRFASHDHLNIVGLHMHLGSPMRQVEPIEAGCREMARLVQELADRGHRVSSLDIGGGIGVSYGDDDGNPVPPISSFADVIVPTLKPLVDDGVRIILEPGRWLVANAGALLVGIQYLKRTESRRFIVCDGGMHNLIRPVLYDAFHLIWPTCYDGTPPPAGDSLDRFDVVGPICETADFLARGRQLPETKQGDVLAVLSAGAYGMTMASTYNDHPRPPEVLVDGDSWRVIRKRDTLEDLLSPEIV